MVAVSSQSLLLPERTIYSGSTWIKVATKLHALLIFCINPCWKREVKRRTKRLHPLGSSHILIKYGILGCTPSLHLDKLVATCFRAACREHEMEVDFRFAAVDLALVLPARRDLCVDLAHLSTTDSGRLLRRRMSTRGGKGVFFWSW